MGIAGHQRREVIGRDHLVHGDGGEMIVIIIVVIHTFIIIAIIIMHSSVMQMFSIIFIFAPEHVKEFEIRTIGESTSLGQPYDFQSIMHYSNKAFSRNGGDTIQSKADPTMKLGNENSLSAVDVLQINLLYRCPEALKQGTCAIVCRERSECKESKCYH